MSGYVALMVVVIAELVAIAGLFLTLVAAERQLHAARAELAKRPLPQLRAPDGRFVSGAPK